MSASLVIRNIGQLLTMNPNSGGKGDGNADPVAGLGILFDGAIAIEDEQILWAGKDEALAEAISLTEDTQSMPAAVRPCRV